MRLYDFAPEDLHQFTHPTRTRDNHLAFDAKLFLPGGKCRCRKNRMVGAGSDLVLLELRGECRCPRLAIFAIKQNHPCNDSLIAHLLLDVGAALTLWDTGNSVLGE